MLTNLTVVLENQPGALAGACEVVGQAGVNIEGLCCFTSAGVAILYLAVSDGASARRALESAGMKVIEERAVVAVPLEDRPGGAATALRRIAEAGLNMEIAYQGTGERIMVGTDDVDRLRAVLKE